MTGGAVRAYRGITLRFELIVLPALVVALQLSPAVVAQQTVPSDAVAGGDAPRDQNVEAQIEEVLRNQHTMTSADVQAKLDALLKEDLSGVLNTVQLAGFNALAAAHERLAQAARLDKLNPAAERDAQDQIDLAVAAYIKGAKAAFEAKDYPGAEQAYNRALNHRPNSPEALLGVARVNAASSAKPLQALERYQEYLRVTSKGGVVYEPELYVEIGKVYASANLWHQALKSYRQALSNGVDTDEVAAQLASCYMALNQPEEAFTQAERAISKKQDQPAYYRLYAELLLGRSSYEEAAARIVEGIRVAKERLQRVPDDQTALSILNECYGTYTRALGGLIAKNPSDLKSRLALVRTMQEQVETTRLLTCHQALLALRVAPERDRRDPALLEEQIRLQRQLSHKDLRPTCERLLRIQPNNPVAREALEALSAASQPAAGNAAK